MSSDILCIIPARSGSKGIPNKNLLDFCGEPLISWTINAALDSKIFKRVVVSTDSELIAKVSKACGAEVPFIRPLDLAMDQVHAINVVLHALEWFKSNEGYIPKKVMMLLPTSPLRRAQHIKESVEILLRSNAPSVVSVVDLGKYMTNLRYLCQGELVPVSPAENLNAQRQGLQKVYGVNGAIFLADVQELLRLGSFHMKGALGYIMNETDSIDINSMDDFFKAQEVKFKNSGINEKN